MTEAVLPDQEKKFLFFTAVGKLFLQKKIAQEKGYFFKRLKFFHFNVLIAFTITKIDEIFEIIQDYHKYFRSSNSFLQTLFNELCHFRLAIGHLQSCPKVSKQARNACFVKNALGKIQGYFLKKLIFFIKLSSQIMSYIVLVSSIKGLAWIFPWLSIVAVLG